MADDYEQKLRDTLAANLSFRILISGDSQARIAERTGISTSALSSYVQGTRYPRPGQLDALAKYFHCSVRELTDDPTEGSGMGNISSEARQIAFSFDELDQHGKELVCIIIQSELKRIQRERQGGDE